MPKTLLIIDSTANYIKLFDGIKTINVFDGVREVEEELIVEQAGWEDISLTSYGDSGHVIVSIQASKKPFHPKQKESRTLKVDFVLPRNIPYGIGNQDFRNLVYGFYYNNTPSINSWYSIILGFERPVVFANLYAISKKLGKDKFPLITQYYYPNFREMCFTPSYPIVVKVGHVHAGYGKILLDKPDQLKDLSSVMALHNDYSTSEPFIEGEYDLRIQKIGDKYRVYKRTGLNGWKTNVGTSILEEIPLSEKYKTWIDHASKIFGGLDICALDAIHAKDGQEYILELNDCSIGLGPQNTDVDLEIIRDLVLTRMKETFGKKKEEAVTEGTGSSTSHRRLEVELINSENVRVGLQRRLVSLETEADRVKQIIMNYWFRTGFLRGSTVGTVIGLVAGWLIRKYIR